MNKAGGQMLRNQKGMTLPEIMIVLAIIVIIATFGITQFTGRLKKARINQAKVQIQNLVNALEGFYTDCAFYPSTEEGLDALLKAPATCKEWGPDPYLKKIPKDSWNRDFFYENGKDGFEVYTFGADGKEGGEGADADLSSKDI